MLVINADNLVFRNVFSLPPQHHLGPVISLNCSSRLAVFLTLPLLCPNTSTPHTEHWDAQCFETFHALSCLLPCGCFTRGMHGGPWCENVCHDDLHSSHPVPQPATSWWFLPFCFGGCSRKWLFSIQQGITAWPSFLPISSMALADELLLLPLLPKSF